MGQLAAFRALEAWDRRLLIEASVLLGCARLAVKLLPFSVIARWLGTHQRETPPTQLEEATAVARRVGRAVTVAARNLPWESVCLPQAIAAKVMLNRRQVASTLYLGVARESGLKAHAWLRTGDVVVTGGQGRECYTVVSTFS